MSLGYSRPDDLPDTLSTIMQDIIDDKPVDVSKSILHHDEGVDLLPSNIELSGLEVRLISAISRESVLKICINEVKKNYDTVLIDCMPSLGMLTINALAAADSVVIPTQPHYLSAKGLELLLRSVSKVKRQINPHLRIDGILMTMVMPRTNISKEITATVKSAYGQRIKVFDTQIPHSIRAVEATAEGKSIFAYDKGGKVAAAYEQFGKEVAEIGEKQKNRNRADGKFSYHLVQIAPGCSIGNHIHETQLETHEVIKGRGRCVNAGSTIPYEAGTISIMQAGVPHEVNAGSEGLYLFAKFMPALC